MIDGFALADAVASKVNEGSYTLPFLAKVEIPRDNDPAKLKDLACFVLPMSEDSSVFSRFENNDEFEVAMSLQKILSGGPERDPEVRGLHRVAQEVRAGIELVRITDSEGNQWKCTAFTIDPVFAPDHLLQQSLFTTVMVGTWRKIG